MTNPGLMATILEFLATLFVFLIGLGVRVRRIKIDPADQFPTIVQALWGIILLIACRNTPSSGEVSIA